MKFLLRVFSLGHLIISLFFVACALALIFFAGAQFWEAVQPTSNVTLASRLNAVLESIALLTIAVVTLELGQTIVEEEVLREAHMSAPTRVRRFLSRFLVVLVVALAIESLVTVFRFSHESPGDLPYAAAIGLAAAALLAAWGVFIRLNRSAEEIEPEAMQRAKSEDQKIESKTST